MEKIEPRKVIKVLLNRRSDEISATNQGLELWTELFREGRSDFFPTLQDFLHENDVELEGSVRDRTADHLVGSRKSMEIEFPSESMVSPNSDGGIRNTFALMPDTTPAGSQSEQVIELRRDPYLQERYEINHSQSSRLQSPTLFPSYPLIDTQSITNILVKNDIRIFETSTADRDLSEKFFSVVAEKVFFLC